MRVLTLNVASGRGSDGAPLDEGAMTSGLADLAGLAPDVVALQEVDAGQERSGGAHQAAAVAAACGIGDWRFAPAITGTPAPLVRGAPKPWSGAGGRLLGPDDAVDGPLFGVALLVRPPVVAWRALPLEPGIGRLVLRAPDPRDGSLRWWSFPDEPRVAVAAELADGTTVAATHLSFFPPTAVRQLRAVRRWLVQTAPGPVLLAGDLNLPGPVPTAISGGRDLARLATFPGSAPRVQLDRVLVLAGDVAGTSVPATLGLGDHRPVVVDVTVKPSPVS